MLKRVSAFLLFSLLIISLFGVYAQDNSGSGSQNSGDGNDDSVLDDDTDGSSDDNVEQDEVSDDETLEEDEIEDLVEEAESFDEELEVNAGLTPGSIFYFLDGIVDSREEKVAEMRKMAEACNQGDEDSCSSLRISFEKYKTHAEAEEREINPEEKENIERETRAIRGVVVREIAKNAPPTLKDEIVREIILKENSILTSADIVAEIERLCKSLIEDIGDYKAAKMAGCIKDESEDDFEYLKKKRGEWKVKISAEAEEFLDILQVCMEVSDDDILGNTESCGCDKMPGENADLCFDIVKLEDACGAGQENSCGKSEDLIEEFMNILPEDLRIAMEQKFGEFEEEKFDRRGPPSECGGLDFRECVLKMAEVHIQEAPRECRDSLREAIRNGEIKGPRDGERICREIMMKEFGDNKCVEENLSPDECAKLMSGFDRAGPRGPGVDFVDCEGFESDREKLECYRHNTVAADFTSDYYNQRSEFRQRGEFDDFEFERRFRDEHRGDYEKHYSDEVRFKVRFRTEEEARADFEKRRTEHETRIKEFISSCDGAWDCSYSDIAPENPCRCYEERDYQQEFRSEIEFEFRHPEGFVPPEGFTPPEGFSPPEGFESFEGFVPPEEFSNSESGSFEPGSSGEGSLENFVSGGEGSTSSGESSSSGESAPTTGGFITGNAFLDYYFGQY